MTPEQRALRAAYLAELWPTCRELSRAERMEKRESDAAEQALLSQVGDKPRDAVQRLAS